MLLLLLDNILILMHIYICYKDKEKIVDKGKMCRPKLCD